MEDTTGADASTIAGPPPRRPTRDHTVLVGKLAEILREVDAMFIDVGVWLTDLRTLRALRCDNVLETNFGLVHWQDRIKTDVRTFMWDKTNCSTAASRAMKGWRPTW